MRNRDLKRIETKLRAEYQLGFTGPIPVVIRDISIHGCRLENVSRNLFKQDQIAITIDGIEPIVGEIRWLAAGDAAGVQFTTSLTNDQLTNLLPEQGQVQKVWNLTFEHESQSIRLRAA